MASLKSFTSNRYGNNDMRPIDWSPDRVRLITKLLPINGKLLEIGTWDGTIIKNYRPKFTGEIYGLDMQVSHMEKAMHLLVEAKGCDLESDPIPWDDGFFDIAVCGEVIEHIFDTDRLVQETYRVLRPGGIAIFTTPNLVSFFNRIFLLFGLQPLYTEVSGKVSNYGNPFRKSLKPAGHIRAFTPRAFKDIMKANGFLIEKFRSVPLAQSRFIRMIEWLFAITFPSLGSSMVIVLKKPE